MNPALTEAVTESELPITVTLGEKEYPLSFPLHACSLYQQATAKLDRGRREARGPMTADEIAGLREQRRLALGASDTLQDQIRALPEGTAHADMLAHYWDLIGEALTLQKRLDEEGGRGDSLFQEANWFKISPDDPERLVLALWAGLHREQANGNPLAEPKWTSPFTVPQLRKLVDPSNSDEVLDAISRALRAYAVKKKQNQISRAPAIPGNTSLTETTTTAETSPSESPSSGPLPASTLA